jgi:glycosyltransferase involved in cell wall biosynthesis
MESIENIAASLATSPLPETLLVSAIVTTKNEELRLGSLLASLKAQTYANLEIIVVDNNSNDATKAIAARFTDKVYNWGPERSAQRNYAVSQAQGRYVLILDADMELAPTVVEDCVKVVRLDPTFKALVIPEESFGAGYWAKCKWLERSCYVGDATIEAARFFDKAVFEEFGGYDTKLNAFEDWDLPNRIKQHYKLGRINSFIRHNEGHLKLTTLMRKKRAYAKSLNSYLNKHSQTIVSGQTIYFLRPAFYRNWRHLLKHPLLFAGMVVMLTAETLAAVTGLVSQKFASVN